MGHESPGTQSGVTMFAQSSITVNNSIKHFDYLSWTASFSEGPFQSSYPDPTPILANQTQYYDLKNIGKCTNTGLGIIYLLVYFSAQILRLRELRAGPVCK